MLSTAEKALIGTTSVDAVEGRVNAVTAGGVASERVTVTDALRLLDTLSAVSFAHAYSTLTPAVAHVYDDGAEADQPAAPGSGAVAVSVTRYPLTARLSVAASAVIGTVRLDAAAGIVKALTTGGVPSPYVTRMPTLSSEKVRAVLPATLITRSRKLALLNCAFVHERPQVLATPPSVYVAAEVVRFGVLCAAVQLDPPFQESCAHIPGLLEALFTLAFNWTSIPLIGIPAGSETPKL